MRSPNDYDDSAADSDPESRVSQVAARWLARSDRGFTAAEQDAYLQWLREHRAHRRAVARLAGAWRRLDALGRWRPADSRYPNPELLATRGRRQRLRQLCAAALLGLLTVGTTWWFVSPGQTRARVVIQPGPDRQTLPDGSVAELAADAQLDIDYAPGERRLRLLRGKAHFTVARDEGRPFVVATPSIAVRATGTAFAVDVVPGRVGVWVTEGRVRLEDAAGERVAQTPGSHHGELGAGEAATIRESEANVSTATIRRLEPQEIDRVLAWRAIRLEFDALPLRDAVAQVNRYNARKLVIEDDAIGGILVGGSFRADSADSFARLMSAGFDLDVEFRAREIALRSRRSSTAAP